MRFRDGRVAAGEAVEEVPRLFNRPADINTRQQGVSVRSEHLLIRVFEIVNALVEAINLLNRQRPLEIKTGLINGLGGWFRECSQHHDVCLAHLEGEQQQKKNEEQDNSNYQCERVSFHI